MGVKYEGDEENLIEKINGMEKHDYEGVIQSQEKHQEVSKNVHQ